MARHERAVKTKASGPSEGVVVEGSVPVPEPSMQAGNPPPSAQAPGQSACHHEHSNGPGRTTEMSEQQSRPMLPSVGSIVQAGAFGAALGGMTTGVMEVSRVKHGEISTDEAIKNVVKSSAQGAATMAVATVASQIVRSHPVFGFIALAAAGIGAFVILSSAGTKSAGAHTTPVSERAKETRPPGQGPG